MKMNRGKVLQLGGVSNQSQVKIHKGGLSQVSWGHNLKATFYLFLLNALEVYGHPLTRIRLLHGASVNLNPPYSRHLVDGKDLNLVSNGNTP